MMTQTPDDQSELDDTETLDNGPEKKNSGTPFRMCLATRERLPASKMIRFVCSPDGEVVPDIAGTLPGRGVWVTNQKATLDSLVSGKGGFSRGFKKQVRAPEGLVETVDQLLLKRCQATLGLAKRASDIILGFDQIRNELPKRRPGWLLEASDGAEDGRRRIVGMAVGIYEKVRIANALTSSELGSAFGRENVIHGLVKTGRFSDLWTRDYLRLYEFRQIDGGIWYTEVAR